MSIYTDVLDMGINHDNHCSDLYIRDCKLARELLSKHNLKLGSVSASRFVSNIDGQYWIELPFQFDPYWTKRAQQ